MAKRNEDGSAAQAIPFDYLSAPAQRALRGAGFTTLKQLSRARRKEVLALHGIGRRALDVLDSALQDAGLTFRKK